MLTHLDRSRQSEYLHNTAHLTHRMVNTKWLVLSRLVWFAKRNGTIDGDIAVAANAKTSRRAEILGTRDGGCQGWLRQIKENGFKCCQDRDSILAAEKHLEALGIVEFEREGYGKVAIAHINLRAAALFLELFHPDFDELERVAPGLFRWVKPFCDEILGREFNRKGKATRRYPTDIAIATYPNLISCFPCDGSIFLPCRGIWWLCLTGFAGEQGITMPVR